MSTHELETIGFWILIVWSSIGIAGTYLGLKAFDEAN